MSSRHLALLALLALAGCKDLALPPLPGQAPPGSVSGRARLALPGQAQAVGAAGARVSLLGTADNPEPVETVADDQGYFRLGGLTSERGSLLLAADLDHDGKVDHQRLLSLQALRGGPGKDLSLGELLLVQNGLLRGKVLLGNVATASGHQGTVVYVPEGPFTTETSGDGSFALDGLPEGEFSVSYFHAGYEGAGPLPVTLEGGEERVLATTALVPLTYTQVPLAVQGTVGLAGGAPASGALVYLRGSQVVLSALADATGAFQFADVEVGVYELVVVRAGATTAVVSGLVFLSGPVVLAKVVLQPGQTADAGAPVPLTSDAGAATAVVGTTPRVRVVPFGPGGAPGCPGAGYRLQTGIDLNADGVLQASEVTPGEEVVVCLAPSVQLTPASATVCPLGGVVLTTWLDRNLDGVYEADAGEWVKETVLCSGVVANLDAGTPDAGPVMPAFCNPALPRQVQVGLQPTGLVVGDFDRDGHPDLALTSLTESSFGVYLSQADGTYLRRDQPTLARPRALATADLDGDGLLDVVVLASDTLQVFYGRADGAWDQPGSWPLGGGDVGGGVFLADLDHDQRLDVVVYDANRTLAVWLGAPGRTFTGPTVTRLSAGATPVDGQLADLDHDGWVDLVVGLLSYAGDTFSISLNAHDGGLAADSVISAGSYIAAGMSACDLDGDGFTDLAGSNDGDGGGKTIFWLFNLGDGTFGPARQDYVSATAHATRCGDVTGDGKPDLVASSIALGPISLLRNQGDGGFDAPVPHTWGLARLDPEGTFLLDANGDGSLDVLTYDGTSTLTLVLSSAPGCPVFLPDGG
jgi:hypothetical protein